MALEVRIQWLPPLRNTGVVRVYNKWGQPLLFSATVRRRCDVLKFYAAGGEFSVAVHRVIYRECVRLGIRRACFERYTNGRKVWWKLNRKT
jgi:hypothetical protein